MSATSKKVQFRGMTVAAGWPRKVADAQKDRTLKILVTYERVKYGEEPELCCTGEQPCHDCAVVKGEYHVPGCDMERCPNCGGQLISCDCPIQQ